MINGAKDVEQKQGLTVFSEYGKGTCFTFSFNYDLRQTKTTKNRNSQKLSASERNKIIPSSVQLNDLKISSQSIEKQELKIYSQSIEKPELKSNNIFSTEDIISTRSIIYKKQSIERHAVKAKFLSNSDYLLSISIIDCNCPKVLIVDDNLFNIEVCRRLLSKKNIASDMASNGLEAVLLVQKVLEMDGKKKFCQVCKFYKVIFMDIDMPMKDGIEATKDIISLLKNTSIYVPIIGLSAFHQEEIKRNALQAGMVDYFTKPISSEKIKKILKLYLNQVVDN